MKKKKKVLLKSIETNQQRFISIKNKTKCSNSHVVHNISKKTRRIGLLYCNICRKNFLFFFSPEFYYDRLRVSFNNQTEYRCFKNLYYARFYDCEHNNFSLKTLKKCHIIICIYFTYYFYRQSIEITFHIIFTIVNKPFVCSILIY